MTHIENTKSQIKSDKVDKQKSTAARKEMTPISTLSLREWKKKQNLNKN